MKPTITLLILLLFSVSLNSQNDCLEPRGTYNNNYYTNNVFLHLERQTDDTLLQFIIIPPQEPEQSFYLSKGDSGNYEIHFSKQVANSIHGQGKEKNLISYWLLKLSKDFGSKLIELNQLAMKQVRYPKNQKVNQFGTLYLFAVKDSLGVVRYAEKWSPVEEPNMKEFISICKNILEQADKLKIEEASLISRIDALMNAIKQNSQNTITSSTEKINCKACYQREYRLHFTGDTIAATKETYVMSGKYGTEVKDTLAIEYYVKAVDGIWTNITTGEKNMKFEVNKKAFKRFIKNKGKGWLWLYVTLLEDRAIKGQYSDKRTVVI